MKYYKIVNPDGHNGLVYKEGLNTDPLPFNPSGDCSDGGIYFSREDILAFLDYGSELYEVEPVGEVYENPCKIGEEKKWKAHEVNLKHIGKVCENIHFLVEHGADIHASDMGDDLLFIAVSGGHLNIVKCLVENGADIHAYDDYTLRLAAGNGHLDIVKYLVENGANIHTNNDLAFRWAAFNGHTDVVKYLVENGEDIHADNDYALRLAKQNGHTEVIEYLKSL